MKKLILAIMFICLMGCFPSPPKDTRTLDQKEEDRREYYQSKVIVVDIPGHNKTCAMVSFNGGLYCWDTEATP